MKKTPCMRSILDMMLLGQRVVMYLLSNLEQGRGGNLRWGNCRESVLRNLKENGLQNILNWRNMAINAQFGCLNIGKLLYSIPQKNETKFQNSTFRMKKLFLSSKLC